MSEDLPTSSSVVAHGSSARAVEGLSASLLPLVSPTSPSMAALAERSSSESLHVQSPALFLREDQARDALSSLVRVCDGEHGLPHSQERARERRGALKQLARSCEGVNDLAAQELHQLQHKYHVALNTIAAQDKIVEQLQSTLDGTTAVHDKLLQTVQQQEQQLECGRQRDLATALRVQQEKADLGKELQQQRQQYDELSKSYEELQLKYDRAKV